MSRLSQLHLAIMSTYATIDQEPKVKDIDESRALLVQHLRDLVAVFGAEMRRIMGAKAPAPVASLLPAPETLATAESHAAAESTFAQPDRWYPDDGQWVECQELTGAIPDELAYDSVIQVLFASERWSKRAGVNLTYPGLYLGVRPPSTAASSRTSASLSTPWTCGCRTTAPGSQCAETRCRGRRN